MPPDTAGSTGQDRIQGSAARPTCKTPGAEWYLRAGDRGVCVEVEFPMSVDLTRGEAGRLNVAMHKAIEAVLAPYFRRSVDA